MKAEQDATARGYRFKTFSGVFLPSILTILGVVMFMRLGTIVGDLGVFGAFGILLFAESIAVATGLSISGPAYSWRWRRWRGRDSARPSG